MQGASHQMEREEFAVILSEITVFTSALPVSTGSAPDRPTSPPIPAHRAWQKEKQNKNLQLHTQKGKKEQMFLQEKSKWKKQWMTQQKETTTGQ